MPYTASVKKSKSTPGNFSGLRTDANRVAMTGAIGNVFQTIDAETSPVVSPVTVNTTAVLKVPQGAISCIIVSVTNPVRITEDSTRSTYFTLPAGVPLEVDVANQQYIYLETTGSTVVSFMFKIV